MFCFFACGDTPASGQPSNGGNTTTPTEQTTPTETEDPAVPAHNSTYGDAPYDADLGNGFNVHNFLGENTDFEGQSTSGISSWDRVNAIKAENMRLAKKKLDYYLGDQAIPYIKYRTQQWYQGMNAASKAYFQNFYNAIMAMQYTKGYWDPAHGLDDMMATIIEAAETYIYDCVENLDDAYERCAYQVCWDVQYGEAYKEGMGEYRTCQSQMDEYDYSLSSDNINQSGIKNYAMLFAEDNPIFINAGVNLQQEYANNNFAGTTQLYRNLLGKIANKKGVETNAMVEMHNIWAFTGSLRAAHQRTAGQNLVQHSNCNLSEVSTIDGKIQTACYTVATQQNNYALSMLR